MENLFKLLKSAGIYFVGNVLTRMVSFFLLPVYTAFIAKNDMGYFDLSTSYLNIIVPIVCIQIWGAMMRFIFDFKKTEDKYKVIFNGLVVFSTSIIIYSVLFIIAGYVFDIKLILFIFIYGLLIMMQNVYTYLARGLGFNKFFAISGIISSLINSVSNIVLILVFKMGIESLFISMILGLGVQAIFLESKVKLIKHISFKYFDKVLIKNMIKFSLPLCLNSVCFWALSSYNKVGISRTLGLEANGLYTVAGKFTMLVAIVANCFSLAWQELAYSKGNEKESKNKMYNTAANYYINLLLFGVLLILPIVNIVFPFLVNENYGASYNLIPIYMFATALSTYSSFICDIYGAEKRNGPLFWATFSGAVVNIVVFHLLVNVVGLQAANIGLALGYIVNIIIGLLLLKNITKIKLQFKKIFLILILYVPCYYVYFTQNSLVNFITFLGVCLIAYLLFRDVLKSFVTSSFNKLKSRKEQNLN